MWLTPVFMGGGVIPLEVVCSLKGNVLLDTILDTTTIPTPSCFQEGDIQFVVFTQFTSGNPSYTNVGLGNNPEGGDWIFLHDGSGSTNDANNVYVYARRWASGHTAFKVEQPSGALSFNYLTFIVRNIPAGADFVLGTQYVGNQSSSLDVGGDGGEEGDRCVWHPWALPLFSDTDAILVWTDRATGATNDFTLPAVDGSRVLYADEQYDDQVRGIASVMQNLPATPYVNLGGAGEVNAEWTLQNMSLALDANNTIDATYTEVDSSVGPHAIYKDVTLVDGETYFFNVWMWVDSNVTGNNSGSYWLSVEDPSTVIHAVGSNNASTVMNALGGVLTVDDMARGKHMSLNADFADLSVLRYTATESGTHRFRISTCTQQNVQDGNFTGALGSVTRFIRPAAIGIVKMETGAGDHAALGYARRNNVNYWDSYSEYPLLGPYQTDETANRTGYSWMTVRGKTGPRPPCRLGSSNLMFQNAMDPDFLTLSFPNGTMAQYATGTDTWHFIYSDHCVGSWHGDKLYFEVTIDAGASNGNFGIGVSCVGFTVEARAGSLTDVALDLHWYGQAVGTARNGTTVDTAPAAWNNLDVIGVLLNFVDFEITITVNGTVWKTWTMPTDLRRRHGAWRACILHSGSNFRQTTLRYTANFTGPFADLPTGAVAFDFDNEVV
jgi:hypothetical protein